MLFSNDQLKSLIDGKMIGEIYPYITDDQQAVLNYLKMIRAEFERMPNLHCEPDLLHFGSGYASYVEWFFYTDDEVEISEKNGMRTFDKEGLIVDISLQSPVILIGTGFKSNTIRIETGESLNGAKTFFSEPVDLEIPERFTTLKSIIERTFLKHHYTILQKEDVTPRLPFEAYIPTLHRDPHEYLIWDAIFYWED
ncbi:hypothetical protein [Oceanobacillus sp. CAU 1775]